MEYTALGLCLVFFIIAFAGLVYPIIPSALFILTGFFVYGWLWSFEELNWLFWTIELLFVLLLFGADMLANLIGVKKFGGSRAGLWGSTIGLLTGPFIIPVAGILIGPFLGAVIAELIVSKSTFRQAVKTGFGSLVGFLTSVITKGIILLIMIVLFFVFIN